MEIVTIEINESHLKQLLDGKVIIISTNEEPDIQVRVKTETVRQEIRNNKINEVLDLPVGIKRFGG